MDKGCRLWAEDYGLWAVDCGLRTMGCGLWTVGSSDDPSKNNNLKLQFYLCKNGIYKLHNEADTLLYFCVKRGPCQRDDRTEEYSYM